MNKLLLTFSLLTLVFSCKSPEARRPISESSGSFIKESVERNKELYAKEQSSIEAIMQQNPEHEYLASNSGFWYYYNTKENDSLEKPDFGDIVNFDYNVKSLNGDFIYTKEELKTQNYAMDKQELFTGLREGLKLMKAGETVTFLFPSQKAYGYYGDNNKIGTSIPLICEVTVNSITQNQSN
ncbi:gliding motility-associated peptidyl-prolyl isomerase GldI [Oceanihabitans sediminis]|uniref:Peptidyl-prolyl cis-trans isomerase n=1 Tax=Oceanihabitans sediminis TaxID=1812012 RepID=A0A368P3E7_9FLAO|nr:gliding motility-associated peptidyl-prolyl isomerase GldI [Oceanihabitans sediminis]MDX1277965.1 gliding motility-associated peptidyl-prolyl isomerase GldI [Oceanihabitans sediminis]MDX1774126.1 gliding motility-associated peptidyl-prolyl isomerase GldI [Oceanihabitans sediminis]RBP30833.1 protein involved in gliding motility GldI [Oceanihabitans sediminis]RCU56800.1 gliding motility-associated peptidyl-prolyl isomerase GldI [Oceanihabitans sediminis]